MPSFSRRSKILRRKLKNALISTIEEKIQLFERAR